MAKNKNIFLIGFMGTGKSTVSKELAKILGRKVVELDHEIELKFAMTIPEIFEKYGEQKFRKVESEILRATTKYGNKIVSTGGGIVLDPDNTEYMRSCGEVYLLCATPEAIYNRVKRRKTRPLLQAPTLESVKKMLAERDVLYRNAADMTIYTKGKNSKQIARELSDTIKDKIKLEQISNSTKKFER